MNTRVRIDLSQGIIEAEGSEEFVRSVYGDFKNRMNESPVRKEPDTDIERKKKTRRVSKASGGNIEARKPRPKNPQIVGDLDLSGKGGKVSLRDFYAQYAPANNFENNLIFVYYLKQELKMKTVGIDHVFTCYRNIPSLKVPKLDQSLWDTKNRKGWLDTSSLEDIQLNVPGINYLEHDMKKAEKVKVTVK